MANRRIKKNKPRSNLLRVGIIVLLAQSVYAGPLWAEAQEEHKFILDITANQNWVSGPGAAQS